MIPSSADAGYRLYEMRVGARRGRTRGRRWTAWADHITQRRRRRDGRPDRARMTIVLGRSPISIDPRRAVYPTVNATHLHLAVNRFEQPSTRPTCGGGDRGTVVSRSDSGRGRPASAGPGRVDPAHPRAIGSEGRVVRADTRVIAAVRPASSLSRAHLVDDVVRRVTRRSQRIEVTDTSRRVTRARVDVMAEVARVLTAPDSLAGTDAPARGSTRQRTAAPAAAPSQFDIESLTDQIVTRLDDRLTAHRERFGRAF